MIPHNFPIKLLFLPWVIPGTESPLFFEKTDGRKQNKTLQNRGSCLKEYCAENSAQLDNKNENKKVITVATTRKEIKELWKKE